MRLLLVSPLFIFVVACGSSPTTQDTPAPPRDELHGLVWGSSRGALEQQFPSARSDGQSVQWTGTYTGRAANLTLLLGDQGLSSIDVAFQSAYPSMDACGKDWAAVREDMNAFYGRSSSDNLAAYWETPTQAVRLSCDPNDLGASLTAHFEPPTQQ